MIMIGFKGPVLFKQLAVNCDIDVFRYNLCREHCPDVVLDQLVHSVKSMRQQHSVACLDVFDVERARKARSRIEWLLMNTHYLIGIYKNSRLAGICFLLNGQHSDCYQSSFAIRLCVFPDFQGKGLAHRLMAQAFEICLGLENCRLTAIIRLDNWASRSLFETWRVQTQNKPPTYSHQMLQHRMYTFTQFQRIALRQPVINAIRIEQFFRHLNLDKTKNDLSCLNRKFKSKDWLRHGWTHSQLVTISNHMGKPINLLQII